jgi:outer membrane protein assembly factor BamA
MPIPEKARHILLSLIFLFLPSLCVAFSAVPNESDTTLLIVRQINLIGNAITRDAILYRELPFQTGDTLKKSELKSVFERAELNLFNTRLFNTTEVSWIEDQGGLRIFVIVQERWYIFPIPVLEVAERNFNAWWATKDYSRLVYGMAIDWRNVTGRNDQLTTTIRLGYTQKLSFNYSIPFINKRRNLGLSFNAFTSRNHETNVKTEDNRQFNIKLEERYVKKESGGGVGITYRPGLYNSHLFELNYRTVHVTDTVVAVNTDYFTNGDSSQQYISFRYLFKSNHVDIAVYPTEGYYFDVELNKIGLPALGENVDILYVTGRAKYFLPLKKNWFAAWGATLKVSGNTFQPFYNTKALGYNKDFIRGYEYYVIDGQDFGLMKSELRYAVIPRKTWHAGFVPSNKFNIIPISVYASVFMDAGYVKDKQFAKGNPLTNSWQYGYGAGLDLFTTYDLILRLEYSFNKLGESGFFVHFTTPI